MTIPELVEELEVLSEKYYKYARSSVENNAGDFAPGFWIGLSNMCLHIIDRVGGKKPLEKSTGEVMYDALFTHRKNLLHPDDAEQMAFNFTEEEMIERYSQRHMHQVNCFINWLMQHEYKTIDNKFFIKVDKNGKTEYREAVHEFIYNFDGED